MYEKWKIVWAFLQYRFLLKFPTRKQLEAYQEKKNKNHLAYVTTKSSFYQNNQGQPLSAFPLMCKEEMMAHFNEINTAGIDREEALHFAVTAERTRSFEEKLKGITVGLSSGTSGNRGIFLVHDDEKAKWAGRIIEKFCKNPLKVQRIAFFLRADSNLYQSVQSSRLQFRFFDIYRPMEEILIELESFDPTYLVAPPSVLQILAEAKQSRKIQVQPSLIISVAEVLELQDADRIKAIFDVEVIHQIYQCTEGFLGCTCAHGTLHLNEDIVHIEKEYIGNRRFVPIVTDFHRKAQPTIRYRLNDILVERETPCPCGSPLTALEQIEGREDDTFLFLPKEGCLPVVIFSDFIRRAMIFPQGVGQYRVVQDRMDHISIYAEVDEVLQAEILSELRQVADQFQALLPQVSFYEYCDASCGEKLRRIARVF